MLREDSAWFTDIYRLLLRAARGEGTDRDRLPDFLDLEDGGEFALLGQDELGTSVFQKPCGIKLPAAPPRVTGQSKIPNGSSWPRPA